MFTYSWLATSHCLDIDLSGTGDDAMKLLGHSVISNFTHEYANNVLCQEMQQLILYAVRRDIPGLKSLFTSNEVKLQLQIQNYTVQNSTSIIHKPSDASTAGSFDDMCTTKTMTCEVWTCIRNCRLILCWCHAKLVIGEPHLAVPVLLETLSTAKKLRSGKVLVGNCTNLHGDCENVLDCIENWIFEQSMLNGCITEVISQTVLLLGKCYEFMGFVSHALGCWERLQYLAKQWYLPGLAHVASAWCAETLLNAGRIQDALRVTSELVEDAHWLASIANEEHHKNTLEYSDHSPSALLFYCTWAKSATATGQISPKAFLYIRNQIKQGMEKQFQYHSFALEFLFEREPSTQLHTCQNQSDKETIKSQCPRLSKSKDCAASNTGKSAYQTLHMRLHELDDAIGYSTGDSPSESKQLEYENEKKHLNSGSSQGYCVDEVTTEIQQLHVSNSNGVPPLEKTGVISKSTAEQEQGNIITEKSSFDKLLKPRESKTFHFNEVERRAELNKKKKVDLKVMLEQRKLNEKGKKTELVERILEAEIAESYCKAQSSISHRINSTTASNLIASNSGTCNCQRLIQRKQSINDILERDMLYESQTCHIHEIQSSREVSFFKKIKQDFCYIYFYFISCMRGAQSCRGKPCNLVYMGSMLSK